MDYKIVVVGGGAVGKSAVSVQFVSRHFVEVYDPTIEDSYRTQKHVDGEVAHIELLDTAGQEEYSCMTEMWLRGSEGYLVVYSITSRESFAEVENYLQKIERTKDMEIRNSAVMVFGNKNDLEELRQVGKEEGRELTGRNGCDFLEGSAKKRVNIEEAFDAIVRKIRLQRVPTKKNKGQKACKKQKCTLL